MSADQDGNQIRPATEADLPAIGAIDARITGAAKDAYWRDMFDRFGNRADRYFLLSENAGRVEGYIAGEVRAWEFGSPPSGWVFAIGTDPDARQRKVASRLFAAIAEAFRGRGVDTLRTMIARDDDLIMSFFRSQGMMAGPFVQLEMSVDEAWPGDDEAEAAS